MEKVLPKETTLVIAQAITSQGIRKEIRPIRCPLGINIDEKRFREKCHNCVGLEEAIKKTMRVEGPAVIMVSNILFPDLVSDKGTPWEEIEAQTSE